MSKKVTENKMKKAESRRFLLQILKLEQKDQIQINTQTNTQNLGPGSMGSGVWGRGYSHSSGDGTPVTVLDRRMSTSKIRNSIKGTYSTVLH